MTPHRHTVVVHRRSDAWTALAAGAATALAPWAVSGGTVGAFERAIFRFVNGWPDSFRPVMYVFQLLGVLGAPLVVAVVALVLRQWRLALGLVLLVPIKLVVEKDILKAVVHRERPGTTIPDAVLRHVPSAGDSFPSGHAIIAFGMVVLLAPYLRRRWQLLLVIAAAVLNSLARVYLGAHNPLDVVGGALAGITIGALLNVALGVPCPGSIAPTARVRRARLTPARPTAAGGAHRPSPGCGRARSRRR
jgi:membrane-associated phospholipid phosphatase